MHRCMSTDFFSYSWNSSFLRSYIKIMIRLLLIACIACTAFAVRMKGVHQCVHATTKIKKNGDGKALSSCMNCDPARPTCYFSCQPLIDLMYLSCDEQCLPEGYFFDSGKLESYSVVFIFIIQLIY